MNLKNKSIINTFVPVGDLYHWYGMGYTNCSLETGIIPPQNCPGIYFEFGHCGFRTDHAVNLYTSPDLENWTFIGDIFPKGARPDGIYFRYKRESLLTKWKSQLHQLLSTYLDDDLPRNRQAERNVFWGRKLQLSPFNFVWNAILNSLLPFHCMISILSQKCLRTYRVF